MCLAIPGKIESIDESKPALKKGRVNFGGVYRDVFLGCVPEAKVGDFVIVHVGFAISVVDEKEARETFQYLKNMGELSELEADRP